MAYRRLIAPDGVVWEVWMVTPSMVAAGRVDSGPVPLAIAHAGSIFAAEGLTPAYRKGWLAFRSESERRRLAPIPSDWEESSYEQLVAMLERAEGAR